MTATFCSAKDAEKVGQGWWAEYDSLKALITQIINAPSASTLVQHNVHFDNHVQQKLHKENQAPRGSKWVEGHPSKWTTSTTCCGLNVNLVRKFMNTYIPSVMC